MIEIDVLPLYEKDVYEEIVALLQKSGLRVRHVSGLTENEELAGQYDMNKRIVYIDAGLKDTREGCHTLLHELRHHQQFQMDKWFDFYFDVDTQDQDQHLQIVYEAECDANRWASDTLMRKWDLFYPGDEYNENTKEKDIKEWCKYYFEKD